MHKKALTVAIAGALAAPMAAQAVDFAISGQVNRALYIVENDLGTTAMVDDNTASSTRVRITGSSELMEGNSVGVHLEYEEGSRVQGPSGIRRRHANVWFSGAFGKLTLGHASEAGDGAVYSDKSGVTGIGIGQLWNSPATLYGQYFDSLDAGDRHNLIRYDTPTIGVASGAVSIGDRDGTEWLSMKIGASHEVGGTSVSGTLASRMGSKGAGDTMSASLGIELASGITWSVAWSAKDTEGTQQEKPSYVQSLIGYKFGDSAVGAVYYGGNHHSRDKSSSTAIGVGLSHNLPKAGVNLYAAIQNHDVEDGVVNANGGVLDANGDGSEVVATIGTKITF